MAVNFYGSGTQARIIHATIKDKGHLAKGKNGCGEAYADVEINGKEKQIVFGCDDDIDKATEVILTLKQGLLGFHIIAQQQAH